MSLRVQALSIVDAVADHMRHRILSGDLQRDHPLTEAEVAALYQVARPTAKAAIEKLVASGLLVRGTHKTARVPTMTTEDVRDLYFVRTCIEGAAVRNLAARRLLPAGMRKASADARALGKDQDLAVIDPVIQFHQSLVEAVESPRLTRLFVSVMGEMQLCMAQMHTKHLLRATLIVKEHQRITDCISAGEVEGAAAALDDHLAKAQQRLLSATQPRPCL